MKEISYNDFTGALESTIFAKRSDGVRIPADGMIELTKLCSIKCTHCYIGDGRWKKDPNELTTQQVKDLLDALAERGTMWLCFTGGEAMIRRDFRELWIYAKKKGFVLTLFSNATLIDDSMADFLLANPPFNLEISIYGATEETYERVSLVKGSFKRFMRGIENVRSRKHIPWRMKTVLIKENAHELDEMKRLAAEWGVSFKFDSNINPSTGEGESAGLAPCASRTEPETAVAADVDDFTKKDDYKDLLERLGETKSNGLLFECGAGQNAFYVTSRGEMQMCLLTGHRKHELRGEGDIAAEFDRGWAKFGDYRQLKQSADSPCHGCDIANLCHNCPGFAQLENGDENAAVEFLCRSTHLKAHALGIKHECSVKHYVYGGKSHEQRREETQSVR